MRFIWERRPGGAHWEQAFSLDGLGDQLGDGAQSAGLSPGPVAAPAVCNGAGVAPESTAAHLAEVLASLARPEAYPHPVDAVTVIQTHVSVVFLAGPFAYKVKKPVHFDFLDAHCSSGGPRCARRRWR